MERPGTVAIIGVGLIGGSIGHGPARRGARRSQSSASAATPRPWKWPGGSGAIDEGTTDPARGVEGADVAVVCTPVSRIAADAIAAAAAGPRKLLVTDAGSTKRGVVEGVEADPLARSAFVGAHPIAGSERKGAAHARADLFEGRACVLTPTGRTPIDRLDRARAFWRSLGCRTFEMGPAAHDDALAFTSHLPHAVAAALAAAVPEGLLSLAAGAYRDGTRVAAADAELWAGIFLANRMPLLEALGAFQGRLTQLKGALIDDDKGAIVAFWEAARARRLGFEPTETKTLPRTAP